MTQGRLVNLAIMSIESDILREIDFTASISDFGWLIGWCLTVHMNCFV